MFVSFGFSCWFQCPAPSIKDRRRSGTYWAWNASIGWVSSTGPELANTMSLVPVMNSVGTVIGACCHGLVSSQLRWRFRYQLSPPV